VKLVKSAILLLNQRDYATINKIPAWLFAHFDDEPDENVDAEDPAITTIVEALKDLFELSMSPEKQAASPLLKQIASSGVVKQGL
jgi:hypothetical protein